MQFNSFAFLGFFAVVAVLYYLAPQRWRWALLLVASYYFYSSFAPPYMLLLGFATLVAYGFGLAVAREPRPAACSPSASCCNSRCSRSTSTPTSSPRAWSRCSRR